MAVIAGAMVNGSNGPAAFGHSPGRLLSAHSFDQSVGGSIGLCVILRSDRGPTMAGTRKIAAILVAGIVGYSQLAEADEDRTLARLRALRSDLIDPTAPCIMLAWSSAPRTAAAPRAAP